MRTAIIIDDVENARIGLKKDLEDYCPGIEVIGEADGVVSGAKIIKQMQPDIVFLDIHIKEGSGFDILELLPEINFGLIFTTSSNEFAIKAFRFSAIDYLLKPIDPEELMQAVKKASTTSAAHLDTLKTNMDGPQKLALNSQDKIQVVNISEVVRLESSGSYTLFCMADGEQILVTRTLKEFDQMLEDQGFIRVHQSHLVNLEYIKEFNKSDGGFLVLRDKKEVPVSSRKKSAVMRVLTSAQ
ncbi:MAG: response regulator transcription factor [Flavobacteriales bacterium]|nr:response regulator transcription factor [Flavobacteriales bacterium]